MSVDQTLLPYWRAVQAYQRQDRDGRDRILEPYFASLAKGEANPKCRQALLAFVARERARMGPRAS